MRKLVVTTILCICAIFSFCVSAECAVIHVSTSGNDVNSGESWDLAKKTIAAGLTAAVSGDQVWVAKGFYNEYTTVKSGVALYGGFLGNEGSLGERPAFPRPVTDPAETIIVSHYNNTAITASIGAAGVDGFTIKTSDVGGGSSGINAQGGSTVVCNNTIIGQWDCGVYCTGPTIVTNNHIISCRTYGIYSSNGSPTIANNIIAGNGYGGIYCTTTSSATITNNTILDNSTNKDYGGGIVCSSATVTISNNIIAFNRSGITTTQTTSSPVLNNNCVYNPEGTNYIGLSAGTGDFSEDPKIVSAEYQLIHLRQDSPCINAGNNSRVQSGWVDTDGLSRIYDSTVDMGADEYDSTEWSSEHAIVRVSPSGDDVNNGSTWQLAKRTLKAAIEQAATTGGEVWVAAGVYNENIYHYQYIYLFGGFDGTENSRIQRDYKKNLSILDGAGTTNPLITSFGGLHYGTIDGFVIRNASPSGNNCSICCHNTDITISNNLFIGNKSSAIGCYSASPRILNNIIKSSTSSYTSGIRCSYSPAPLIAGNVIAGNSGGNGICIYSESSSPSIVNNTIIGNSGGVAVYLSNSPATLSNNIVAFNSAGIYNTGTGTVTLRNNCVYNPDSYNYSGLSAGDGDISVNPLVVSVENNELHLQPGSECINAGNDTDIKSGWVDIDGGSRIYGGRVDIGADEYDDTIWTSTPNIIRVSTRGNDANDGSSWDLAKKTIQSAVDAAASNGEGEIWVAAGVYNEKITLYSSTCLYGGFAGTENARSERNSSLYRSIIDGSGVYNGIDASLAGYKSSVIDGFTITNSSSYGIYCGPSALTISNNLITSCKSIAIYSTGSTKAYNNKIIKNKGSVNAGSNSEIVGNTITGNIPLGGIVSSGGSQLIANNLISGNMVSDGGIDCISCDSAVIENNIILGNTLYSGNGGRTGGILCRSNSTGIIRNNTIKGNYGYGIYSYSSVGTIAIISNTLVGNTYSDGGAIYLNNSPANVINNIVAFNSSGIAIPTGNTASVVLRNNCVYNPNGTNYTGLSAGDGDISTDPKFVSNGYGDVHLQSDSPCINTGDSSVVGTDWLDMDGENRIYGENVDIGADEFDGTIRIFSPRTIRVSPTGDDLNDGSSWYLAKRTINAGISEASIDGGEVWVAAGTYNENVILLPYTYLYGGFAGNEVERSARDYKANSTIINGGAAESAVLAAYIPSSAVSGIDGFRIQNGSGSPISAKMYGGGIFCYYASPVIENNTITGNVATYGGGIGLSNSSSRITNNRITANSSGSGSGIYCDKSSPIIDNNIILGNIGGTNGQGGIYLNNSPAQILNNTVSGNSGSGGIVCYTSSAVIANNVISANYSYGLWLSGSPSALVVNNSIAGHDIGLWCANSSPTIVNNLITHNDSAGVYVSGTTSSPILKNNCIYTLNGVNYTGITDKTGKDGNISVDPKIASPEYGQLYLQPSSPCIDAGDNSLVQGTWVDRNGQPRIQDGNGDATAITDIGAYEFDGTGTVFTPVIIRVSTTGNDANEGNDWSHTKLTVQNAIDTAFIKGGEVWAVAGIYNERIIIHPYVHLFGGFSGAETTRAKRDWKTNKSILDGNAGGTVVTFNTGQNAASSEIDGFTIRNGNSTSGAGIFCNLNVSPKIANNTIAENAGCGLKLYYASPIITGNTITKNNCGAYLFYANGTFSNNVVSENTLPYGNGGGVYIQSGSVDFRDNIISGNSAANGGGIYHSSFDTPIWNCVIKDNTATQGGGIYCYSSEIVTNNIISGNSATSGSGIYINLTASPLITSNTIVRNLGNCRSIYICEASPRINNNIIAFNSGGIEKSSSTGSPTLTNNCVYNPSGTNYVNLTAGGTNISVDPGLTFDYHLLTNSPCINAGTNSAYVMSQYDMDGENRIFAGTIDIGADEFYCPPLIASGVKNAQDGCFVYLDAPVVSAVFSDCLYVEAEDRSSGIRVFKQPNSLIPGKKVNVMGWIRTTPNGERYINASYIPIIGDGSIEPVFLTNRNLGGGDWNFDPSAGTGQRGVEGGAGLNNIGILVKTTGKVTEVGYNYFYIDDGTKAKDSSTYTGIRVSCGSLSMPKPDQTVLVTGISTIINIAGKYFRCIRVRTADDIQPLQ
ncbi:MAG: right-handed parallel beta-helix repeat-containing protein [Armatimonadota bacterium]